MFSLYWCVSCSFCGLIFFHFFIFIYSVPIIGIFGKMGGRASEEVILQIVRTKCIPMLLYGLEACPLRKSDNNSLDFVVNRFYAIVSDK